MRKEFMMKLYELLSVFTYSFSKIIPKKKNRWVFGAWFGTAISDNPKAISDYIEKNYPEIEVIWVTNNPQSIILSHGKAVKRNSLLSLKYLITAEVAVMNQGFGDLNACNFLGGCYKVQLWHGIAWKKIFKDTMDKPCTFKGYLYDWVFNYINRYDMYISPSDGYTNIVKSAFNVTEDRIFKCGQPRNDILFSKEFREQNRRKLFEELQISEKKVVVYMPTFRDNKNEVFSFGNESIENHLRILEKEYNFILIEKSHYETVKRSGNVEHSTSSVYYMPNQRAEYLLSVADILITDYSSCFFDFLITDRPIIHYLYDYNYYENEDRGLYAPKESVISGDAPEAVDELFEVLVKNLSDSSRNSELRQKRRRIFISYESERNCEKIINEIKRRRLKV